MWPSLKNLKNNYLQVSSVQSETWIGVVWLQYLPLLRKRVATESPLDIKKDLTKPFSSFKKD
jgi:hypothetical protein